MPPTPPSQLGPEHSPDSPLSIHDVTVAYHRKPVLWDIDYDAPSGGSLIGIVGPNGAGKSTLIKACLGLGLDQKGPSATTLCRHRRRMEELGLDKVYEARFNELLVAAELVKRDEPVLVDSVPIKGAGQQLDSYNLLAGSIRLGLQELAKGQGRSVAEVAEELGLSVYTERTLKGHFDVDWQDEDSRRAFLVQLVRDARRVSTLLLEQDVNEEEQPDDGLASPMAEARETIERVIAHDVEFTDEGEVQGISQVPAGDRLISLTDRDMRHGRKSASVLIAGYKAQIVASAVYGFILMSKVIKANQHDGQDLPNLVQELEQQHFAPQWWAGDHAYGTLANHHVFGSEERGELVARMPRPGNGGRFTKDEFYYDFEVNTLTCPEGWSVLQKRWQTRDQKKGRFFEFPAETCAACPNRARCISPKASDKRGRTVFIVDADERLIREHLLRRDQPEFRARLAQRVGVEHAIAGFAQCSGKQAQRFGEQSVGFDTSLSALSYNLRRLGSLMRDNPELRARVEEQARRLFLCLLRFCLATSIRPNPSVWLYTVALFTLPIYSLPAPLR